MRKISLHHLTPVFRTAQRWFVLLPNAKARIEQARSHQIGSDSVCLTSLDSTPFYTSTLSYHQCNSSGGKS
jgi:hypothetical protein